MSEPETVERVDERGGGFGLLRWVVGLGLALVLYLLSPAPLEKVSPNVWQGRAFHAFYTPLRVLSHRVPVVGRFYEWYYHIWGLF